MPQAATQTGKKKRGRKPLPRRINKRNTKGVKLPTQHLPFRTEEEYNTDVLIAKQEVKVQHGILKYRDLPDGPFRFIEEWLGLNPNPFPNDIPTNGYSTKLPLWSKQREIVEAVFTKKRVAVKSGTGVGKTYAAALVALVFLYVFKGVVITTGKSWRQIREQLWGEIHRIWNHSNRHLRTTKDMVLGGILNQTDLRVAEKWYMIGFSTDEPDRLRGFHAKNTLLIIDEACGVKKELFEASEAILTSKESHVLLIGNPTDPTGEFAKCFEPDSGYHQISISCFDSPNVRHRKHIYPELTSHEWVEAKKKSWGEGSPMYKACVEAEFPEEREDTLIPFRFIQEALDRDLPDKSPILTFSVDVARYGDDRTIMGMRRANGKFRIIEETQGKPTTDTSGRIIFNYKEFTEGMENPLIPINVDDIGVGGGVTDMLVEQEVPCNGVNVGEAPEPYPEDEEDTSKYLNKRSQYFWKLRVAFMNGEVDIDDEELAKDLSRLRYEYTSKGKLQIIDKKKFKTEYGYSPDKADAMMLAWSELEAENVGSLGGWL